MAQQATVPVIKIREIRARWYKDLSINLQGQIVMEIQRGNKKVYVQILQEEGFKIAEIQYLVQICKIATEQIAQV